MKRKFKVGDRVRCIKDFAGADNVGEGTVRDVGSHWLSVEFDGSFYLGHRGFSSKCEDGHGWDYEIVMSPKYLELINKKKGKVKVDRISQAQDYIMQAKEACNCIVQKLEAITLLLKDSDMILEQERNRGAK